MVHKKNALASGRKICKINHISCFKLCATKRQCRRSVWENKVQAFRKSVQKIAKKAEMKKKQKRAKQATNTPVFTRLKKIKAGVWEMRCYCYYYLSVPQIDRKADKKIANLRRSKDSYRNVGTRYLYTYLYRHSHYLQIKFSKGQIIP